MTMNDINFKHTHIVPMDVISDWISPFLSINDRNSLMDTCQVCEQAMIQFWRQIIDPEFDPIVWVKCHSCDVSIEAPPLHELCVDDHCQSLLILTEKSAILFINRDLHWHPAHPDHSWPYLVFTDDHPFGQLRHWNQLLYPFDQEPAFPSIPLETDACPLCQFRTRIRVKHLWDYSPDSTIVVTTEDINIHNDKYHTPILEFALLTDGNILRVNDQRRNYKKWYFDVENGQMLSLKEGSAKDLRCFIHPCELRSSFHHRKKSLNVDSSIRAIIDGDLRYEQSTDYFKNAMQSPCNGEVMHIVWQPDGGHCLFALLLDLDCMIVRDCVPLTCSDYQSILYLDDQIFVFQMPQSFFLIQNGIKQYFGASVGNYKGHLRGYLDLQALGLMVKPNWSGKQNTDGEDYTAEDDVRCLCCGCALSADLRPFLNQYSLVQGCTDLVAIPRRVRDEGESPCFSLYQLVFD